MKGYLRHLGRRWNGLYNATGRGYPDVSAQAANFIVRDHSEWISVGGTRFVFRGFSGENNKLTVCSASTPAIAAVISRLNSARIAQGKPRMGFLNPWLYGHGHTGLKDIVLGSSTGCRRSLGDPRVRNASWDATEGWDPVTGLGTPLFPTLVKLALSDDHA